MNQKNKDYFSEYRFFFASPVDDQALFYAMVIRCRGAADHHCPIRRHRKECGAWCLTSKSGVNVVVEANGLFNHLEMGTVHIII